jgi:hypothetical protein
LSDVVWVIRKFQPDVIITRFPTTGEGGHGHHTASAILANEAFTAATDANRFPEQLKYVQTWQVKRVLWNTFNFGGNNTIRDDQFKIDAGGYNPLLGKSYGEISAVSRSQHKSQGFGVSGSRGEVLEYFATTAGTAPKKDLMDEVNISWKRVRGAEDISKMVDRLKSSFDLLHPENSVAGLVKLYKAIVALEDGYWKNQKLKEVKELIAQCSGLFLDATTSTAFAVQTDSVRINFSFNNRLGVEAMLQRVAVDQFDSSFSKILGKNKNVNFPETIYVSADKPLTQPYWLENKMEEGYYNVADLQKIGQPDVDAAFNTKVTLNIEGQDFNFVIPVKYKFTDPVKGEVYWPVAVIPPYTLKLNPEIDIQLTGANYQKIFTSYKNDNLVFTTGTNGISFSQAIDSFILKKGETRIKDVDLTIDPAYSIMKDVKDVEHFVYVKIDTFLDKKTSNVLHDIINIRHDHLPAITYFKTSFITIKNYTYKRYGNKIGYIIGAGDKVPEALEQMGYEVTLLTDKELSRNNLNQFDAIITGVRAYNTNEWMNKHYDKLMKYVNDGGNLIVQYNTINFVSRVSSKIGPYHFNISRTRITDENAPVTLLKPNHPVLNFPNKITQDDFKGWVQERSIYHAGGWDSTKFETVLSMNDPGEKPDEGSLIIAEYGKGVFVYTGLVFFRELPAGVPGAYRLLANIIALNKKKGSPL